MNADDADTKGESSRRADGGATAPPTQTAAVKPESKTRWQLVLVLLAVITAHLLPFSGAVGCRFFAENGYKPITIVFSFLTAFILTTRVLFEDNVVIHGGIFNGRKVRIWLIQLIGAAVLLAWLVPLYDVAHGVAEASIAAIGIAISIMASAVVTKPTSWLHLGHDLASVLVIVFAFAWSIAMPRGDELVGVIAIGSSSLHSLRTVADTAARLTT